eukprot:TRINITY_DN3255_c0_g1_i1.p1 TRINITY_DN3255_c0_g1~~TRINITY_DN3255_c0_g1_i1.p1  ORF type:complete len:118 (-),score=32.78 TRINITY_DN3255_c0_g1_i1:25-342(-)
MSFATLCRSGWGTVGRGGSVIPARAGQVHRLAQGKPRSGNESGPLHDLADFHFADGTAAPETAKQQKWKQARLDAQERIATLEREMVDLHVKWEAKDLEKLQSPQ